MCSKNYDANKLRVTAHLTCSFYFRICKKQVFFKALLMPDRLNQFCFTQSSHPFANMDLGLSREDNRKGQRNHAIDLEHTVASQIRTCFQNLNIAIRPS